MSRAAGGLQLPSVVECMVARVACELLALLNGSAQASTVVRDSLPEGMLVDPAVAVDFSGLVPNAMRFLAGYGMYVTTSTDRTVARILDAIAREQGFRCHSLVGPFDARLFHQGQTFCRIGNVANAVRRVVRDLTARRVPRDLWRRPAEWLRILHPACKVSAAACARAADVAVRQAQCEWETECVMFGVAGPEHWCIPEDWLMEAWNKPWDQSVDVRSRCLEQVQPVPQGSPPLVMAGLTVGTGVLSLPR